MKTRFQASVAALLSFAILVILAACGRQANQPQWKMFQPTGGRFAVELPGDPIADAPETSRDEVVIKWHIVSTLSGISGLSVGYSEASRSTSGAPKALLESVRDHSVSDLGGEHLKAKDKSITVKSPQGQDLPGLEFQVGIKGGFTVRERVYLSGSRFYALMVVASEAGVTSADAERFFKSFRVLP